MSAAKKMVPVCTEKHTAEFDFEHGATVSVNITGRVVGRSDFLEGEPSYLVEHERKGKLVREWIVADKLVATGEVSV